MSVWRWRPGRAGLAVALTLTLAVAAAAAVIGLRAVEWPVEVVRIDGEMRHTDRDALEEVVAEHVRAGFFGVELPALRAALVDMPWVRDATLRRVWPDRIEVDIREHRAAAVWNEDALVSEQGEVFRPEAVAGEGLPRLAGPAGQAEAVLARLAGWELRLQAVGADIAVLKQDERRSWTVALEDGIELRLGRDQLDARLDRLLRSWHQAVAGRRGDIRAVDLRYPNGFAIAWRDDGERSRGGGV